jgi:demethylmenaquinone methyltransferase / 2-methoxy-6-polyprenyl-1,4-benzoquinol methylase
MEQPIKASVVKDLFGSITPRYDLLNRVLSLCLDGAWRETAVRQAAIREGESILDICTGTGDMALLCAPLVGAKGRVVGIDFCFPMVQRALEKCPASYRQVSFAIGDAGALPFPDNYFDCITVSFGVRNLEDLPGALHEMRRVLAPGGRMLVLEFTRPSKGFFAWLYGLYLRFYLPLLGGILSGKQDAYKYLADSIFSFPPGEEFLHREREAGLENRLMKTLTGGVTTIFLSTKPVVERGGLPRRERSKDISDNTGMTK